MSSTFSLYALVNGKSINGTTISKNDKMCMRRCIIKTSKTIKTVRISYVLQFLITILNRIIGSMFSWFRIKWHEKKKPKQTNTHRHIDFSNKSSPFRLAVLSIRFSWCARSCACAIKQGIVIGIVLLRVQPLLLLLLVLCLFFFAQSRTNNE